MEPESYEQELARNRQAYEALREQIRRDYAGQYVAIAFGKVVATSPDFDEAKAALERLQPAPKHCVVFPASEDPAFEPFYSTYTEFE